MHEETRLAARSLGYLYLAGATIGLVSLLLPDPPRADVPGLYSNVAIAYLGGATLLAGVSRMRPWMLQVALAAGSLLITRAVLLSGGRRAGVCLWQPIVRDQRTVGVLELNWQDGAALQDPSTAGLTSLLAVEAAVTLQRVALLGELEAIARTDELTELPNRRAWEEQLPREVRRADRTRAPLSVAMLDLDHFKLFNDSHGHQSGDRLLQQVARAWVKELRPTDVLSRVGGEEFALALPDCRPEEAVEVIERLRASIPGGQTCSAGVADWNRSEAASQLVGRADLALYDAKRNGRNQTATARPAAAGSAIA